MLTTTGKYRANGDIIEMEKEIAHPYLLLSQQQLIYRYHLI